MDLTDKEFDDFKSRSRLLKKKRGEIVYDQGDQPQGLYFLMSGLVSLLSVSATGSEHILRVFQSCEVFGHRSLFAEEPYHAQSKCLEACEILFLPKSEFKEFLTSSPTFHHRVTQKLARDLRRAEESRVALSDSDVMMRVAQALVYLKEIDSSYTWTRKEIAEYCDSTAPTVVRTLSRLEEKGLIALNGRDIEIKDRNGLINLSPNS